MGIFFRHPPRIFVRAGLILCLSAIAMWMPPGSGHCGGRGASDAQWDFANHLFEGGQYYRAITEFERFLYYFPDDARLLKAKLKIIEAYVRGEWFEAGRETAEALLRTDVPPGVRAKALLLDGICLLYTGALEDARMRFQRAIEVSDDPEILAKARYLMAESYAREEDWKHALQDLDRVPPHSRLKRDAAAKARVIRLRVPPRRKDPWVAGVLAAVLPGAGHLYTGRWRDAALVFSVNGAFAAAATEAVQKENHALAAALALAELVWYSGNIFSAVSGAHKHNRLRSRRLSKEMDSHTKWMDSLPAIIDENP